MDCELLPDSKRPISDHISSFRQLWKILLNGQESYILVIFCEITFWTKPSGDKSLQKLVTVSIWNFRVE